MTAYAPGQAVRAVVFDCDGVILESMRAKGDAFRRLFDAEPPYQDAIEAFHYAHGGMSRYEKFDHIYRDILRRTLTPEVRIELGERYGALVQAEVVACPMVGGAQDLLDALQGRVPLFVASATPDAELKDLLARRGLARYFERITGHPTSKTQAIRDAQAATGIPMSAVVFVGDARADYEAARDAGCRFIGRQAPDGATPFAGTGVPVVADCRQIEEWLRG